MFYKKKKMNESVHNLRINVNKLCANIGLYMYKD